MNMDKQERERGIQAARYVSHMMTEFLRDERRAELNAIDEKYLYGDHTYTPMAMAVRAAERRKVGLST